MRRGRETDGSLRQALVMLQTFPGRLRHAVGDMFALYLLPGFVALLPWPLGFALLKRIARSERLYRDAVEPAWQAACALDPGSDAKEWKYRFRLLRLVDHADVYLTLLRGRGWRRRHVSQSGTWPTPGACVFLTYHWGAGNWIWALLREHGFAAHFVMQRPQGQSHGLTRLSHAFGYFRAWALQRLSGACVLFIGGSSGEVTAALRAGSSIVGMLDLPRRPDQRGERLRLLDKEVRFPVGLARLGIEANAAIAIFSFGLDFASGQRDLRIETLSAGLPLIEVMQRYATHLDSRLRAAPAAWQIWREAPAMFVANSQVTPVSDSQTQGIQ